MKRSAPLRRARPPSRRREPRPGVTPDLPRNWRALCQKIRHRDNWHCRRCGWDVSGTYPQVNHVIARRIAPDLIAEPTNVCLLCVGCHGWVTSVLEPALYRGDVQAFQRFLDVLKRSGPIPDADMLGRAYQTIRELAFG